MTETRRRYILNPTVSKSLDRIISGDTIHGRMALGSHSFAMLGKATDFCSFSDQQKLLVWPASLVRLLLLGIIYQDGLASCFLCLGHTIGDLIHLFSHASVICLLTTSFSRECLGLSIQFFIRLG